MVFVRTSVDQLMGRAEMSNLRLGNGDDGSQLPDLFVKPAEEVVRTLEQVS